MRVTSPAFSYGRRIPARHTADGEEVSPLLHIHDMPGGTISLAVILEDPDAPGGTWVHWLLFDLPPLDRIPEGATNIGTAGVNSWRRVGYGGPCPPSGIHRYLFRVSALDDTLRIPERSRSGEVVAAMRGHLLAEAVLMGRYGH